MELNYTKIIETAVVLILYILIKNICFRIIDKTLSERLLQEARGAILKRVIHTVLLLICLLVVSLVWGVKQADLVVFIGSILTVVGVAFFAQWSILSNITSSLILFFNHPIRIYDSIIIMEGKDYVIEGKIIHIGLFFITIQTDEEEEMTLPNNIFIQKSIKKVTKHKPVIEEKEES